MPKALEAVLRPRIETFQSRSRLDLQPLWRCLHPDGAWAPALAHPWGAQHRPEWAARGLIIGARGGQWRQLRLTLHCPPAWRQRYGHDPRPGARLVLLWWADLVELRVDAELVHRGDLFDSACRWLLPARWWQGQPLALDLRLRSPLHDDAALIHSLVELDPPPGADPDGLALATALSLLQERLLAQPPAQRQRAHEALVTALASAAASDAAALPDADGLRATLEVLQQQGVLPGPSGRFQVLGHAHLDLAWLWPVADTWDAAERTFTSVLNLMERFEELHFGHSTPALQAWLEVCRPALYARIRTAMRAGRWEPLGGPWVESDCLLISTLSLLRQFQEGQHYSHERFPEWEHNLCWLPDSFGFGAGLPAVAAATGVRWFCTHKLAWNADHPFPHALFRWRSRGGEEVLALMNGPIGVSGDPLAMERHRLAWQRQTGLEEALWLPGVGDHGGGPTAEMLLQLRQWQQRPETAPQRHGTLRDHLARLEPQAGHWPVWRDELYLELHRGCATTRPDQKRHNRTLERLLREAELARALQTLFGGPLAAAMDPLPWRTLLFQQFHDILPGTSIPEVFEQAEPEWRRARRQACQARDQALQDWLASTEPDALADGGRSSSSSWWLVQLQPLHRRAPSLRLPSGSWCLGDQPLASQPAAGGGQWVQLPDLSGVGAWSLQRRNLTAAPALAPDQRQPAEVVDPVRWQSEDHGHGRGRGQAWRWSNGSLSALITADGLAQLWDGDRVPQLAAPLDLLRFRDAGEYWDAWDLAANYREHPLPVVWEGGMEMVAGGPLLLQACRRGRIGASPFRLDLRLRAASPWLEVTLAIDWQQRHELLRLECPLARCSRRIAADTTGGVIERPAEALLPRERSRWEVTAISWVASQADRGGLALLLDGPQGVDGTPERLGVSLLRGPTWPDPQADNGRQRLRLALMPCRRGWRQDQVTAAAQAFREPLWCRPQQSACPAPGTSVDLRRSAPGTVVLEALPPGLQLLRLVPDPEPGVVRIALQNLTPMRQLFDPGPAWQRLERLDGLDQSLERQDQPSDRSRAQSMGPGDARSDASGAAPAELRPWQLGFWRLRAQSS
ncbi:MAG: alpha-mannosidase [Cyanobacteriota bacterium]